MLDNILYVVSKKNADTSTHLNVHFIGTAMDSCHFCGSYSL
jgi:hypothetical protein